MRLGVMFKDVRHNIIWYGIVPGRKGTIRYHNRLSLESKVIKRYLMCSYRILYRIFAFKVKIASVGNA